ncbi:ABC transporter ATP-binding protein [Pleomorphomonas sp. PLEO]|uniref:ABC transporter ATP-binding protein n=1 Tax=Pleomorphomonas sp. PLEO TaxID=3239306 RepID=UPI00351F59CC
MPALSALEVLSLARRFGETEAVRNLDLAVEKGEVVSLVGHSGCGKSSLLRLIAGVDTPDEGSIRIDGEEVFGPSRFVEPERRRVGFVFQDYALFPHLTVENNVRFGLRAKSKAQANDRARDMLGLVGLAGHATRYPHELSGGEQQRVALARALAPEPRLLLMDEPFSNLDRALREGIRRETLSLIRRLNITAVIVSHDPEEALSSGDRLVLMRSGEVVQIGSAYDLYDRPNCPYAAEFFAACNRIPGRVGAGWVETALGTFPAPDMLDDGDEAVVLVRPTDIDVIPNTGEGEVTARELMGEIETLHVRLPGLAAPIRIRSTRRLAAGVCRIGVSVTPGQAMIFPT